MSEQTEQRLMIGPLLLKKSTPSNIYNTLVSMVEDEVKRINKKCTTQLNFCNGRFNKHMSAIHQAIEWVDRYEVERLVSLNCAHNHLQDLSQITIFYLPRLQILDLYDCGIESLDLLSNCLFHNLLTLILYNNHITNLKSLRKCWMPYLTQLVVDSNNIAEVPSLSQLCAVHLQKLQLHNNRITDIRPIMKYNFTTLNQLRCENPETSIGIFYTSVLQPKLDKKFKNL